MASTDEQQALAHAEAHHPALWEVKSLSDLKTWFEDHKDDIDSGAAKGVGFWPFSFSAGVAAQYAWALIQARRGKQG